MKTLVHTSTPHTSEKRFRCALFYGALLVAIAGISVIPSTAQTATTELEPGELRARLVGATGTSYVYHLDESGTAIITGQTSATPGGAVYFAAAGGVFTATTTVPGAVILFQSNTSTSAAVISGGGAISMESTATQPAYINVSNIHFKENYATVAGGAIISGIGGVVTANGAVFENNLAGERGGAISVNNSGALTIYANDAIFTSNTSGIALALGYGGAIYTTGVGQYVELDRSIAKYNTTINAGGVLYLGTGILSAVSALFEDNTVTAGDGGALYVYRSSTVTVTSATFNNNSTGRNGGAIFTHNYTILNATSAIFTGNKATSGGGALFLNSSDALTITSATFNYNEAANGGAIYQNGTAALNASGAYFEGNYARSGNGGAIITGAAVIDLSGAVFKSNTTALLGGALYYTGAAAALDLTDAKFVDNKALDLYGGAIYNENGGTITLGATAGSTSLFSGNTANGVANAMSLGNSTSQTVKVNVNVAAGGVLDMQDPMTTRAAGYFSATMTGDGLWKLGGNNVLAPRTNGTVTIQSGTLGLYSGAVLAVAGNGADRFNLNNGTTLKTLGVTTEGSVSSGSATIKTDTIDIASNATLAFTLTDIAPNTTSPLLRLEATSFTTAFSAQTIDILNETIPIVSGTYRLVQAPGASFGASSYALKLNGANFVATTRFSMNLVNDNTAKTLSLISSLTNGTLTWTGGASGNPSLWDIYNTANWTGIDTIFANGDTVIFDDSSFGATTSQTITILPKGVTVAAMTVSTAANHDYTFDGGPLKNTASLTKTGDGNLTLAVNATFTGTESAGIMGPGVFASPTRVGINLDAGLAAGTRFTSTAGTITLDISEYTSGHSAAAITGDTLGGRLELGSVTARASNNAAGTGGSAAALHYKNIGGSSSIVQTGTLAAHGGDSTAGGDGGGASSVLANNITTTGSLQFEALAATGGASVSANGGAATGLFLTGTLQAASISIGQANVTGGVAAGGSAGTAQGISAQAIVTPTLALNNMKATGGAGGAGGVAGAATGIHAASLGSANTHDAGTGNLTNLAASDLFSAQNVTVNGGIATGFDITHLAAKSIALDNITVTGSPAGAGVLIAGLDAENIGGAMTFNATTGALTGIGSTTFDIGTISVTANHGSTALARAVNIEGQFSGTVNINNSLSAIAASSGGAAAGISVTKLAAASEIRLKNTGSVLAKNDTFAAGIVTGTIGAPASEAARIMLEGGSIRARQNDGMLGTNYAGGATGNAEIIMHGQSDTLVFSPEDAGTGNIFNNDGQALRIYGAENIEFANGVTQWGNDWKLLQQADAPSTTATVKSGATLLTTQTTDFNKAANTTLRIDSNGTLKTVAGPTQNVLSSGTINLTAGSILAFDVTNANSGNTSAFLDIDASTFTSSFGTQTLNIMGAINDGETFLLLHASNATFSTAAYTILYNNNALTGRIIITATNNNAAKTLSITTNITNSTLTWTGTDGSNPRIWDINTSNNWKGIESTFLSGDAVVFTNTAAGAVTIASNGVYVKSQNFAAGSAAMLVNGGTYVFNAADATATLTGSGNFRVTGAATDVTLNAVTSFSGTTLLDGGRLTFGDNANSGALAVSAGTLSIAAGKTLTITGTASIASGAMLSVDIASDPALTAGVFATEAGSIINIMGYTSPSIIEYPGSPELPIYTLISSGSNINRAYTLLVAGQAVPAVPVDESTFLTVQEVLDDAKKVKITTGLVWTNTQAGMAHGTFYIDSGTFTFNANLSDNTIDGVGMNGWDGKTLKKTGTGTLVIGGDNTYTGTTFVLEGSLVNTGTLHNALDNQAYAQNQGTILGDVTNSGIFVNAADAELGAFVQTGSSASASVNAGKIDSMLIENGIFSNTTGGNIDRYTQTGGSAHNLGMIGVAFISGDAEFSNSAGGGITGLLDISGTRTGVTGTNSGIISGSTVVRSGTLLNAVGGEITGTLDLMGTGGLNNSGTLSGPLSVTGSARLDATASSVILGDITQSGGLTPYATINYGKVEGSIKVNGGAFLSYGSSLITGTVTVSNTGIFYSYGTITTDVQVKPGGRFYFRDGTTGDIMNEGEVSLDNLSTFTFSKQIIGSGTVFKRRATTLTISTAQPQLLGPFSIVAGTVLLAAVDTLANAESVTVRVGATLNITGRDQYIKHLIAGRTSQLLFAGTGTNFATLTLGELSETANFIMRGDTDVMKTDRIVLTGPSSGDHIIKMTFTGSGSVPATIKIVENNSGSYGARFSGTADIGMDRYSLVQGNGGDDNYSWFLVDTGNLSTTGQIILQTGGIAGTEWHYSLDSLQKRMGEVRATDMSTAIRSNKGNWWLQAGGYELNADADLFGVKFSETVYTVTAGVDRMWMRKKGAVALTGISVQMSTIDRDFKQAGVGSSDSAGLGAYVSFIHPLGWYADITAKYDKYDNELNVRGDVGAPAKADYSNHIFGLSAEVGRIMDAGKNFWLEASLQAALGIISTSDYTTNTGIRVHNNTAEAAHYRARLRLGCTKFGKWVPYAKVALVASNTKGGETLANDEEFAATMNDTRMELGVGSVWNLPWRTAQLYFEYEYSHAATYTRPWAFTISYRQMW